MARAESGSITQLGKNRWRVRVSGGNDPVTGKRIRLSKVVHGTKKDAIAERTRMQIEVGDVDRATKGMTVAQYMEDVYLPWYKETWRANSYVQTKSIYESTMKQTIGHIQLSKLSAYTVETFIKSIDGKCYPNNVYNMLKAAWKKAYAWGLVQKNIFDKLEAPKKEVGPKTVADPELAMLIIAAMVGDPIEPAFLLELGCGLRFSEALGVDWEDIDFREGKVHIHRTWQQVNGMGPQWTEPKTKKSTRFVSIPSSVLARLLEIRCEGGVMRFGPLCTGIKEHGRMAPSTFRQRYKAAYLKKLPNQPYVTPRNLRHTHATILLREKVDIKTIADRLGHSDVKTTMKFYLQPVEELDVEASSIFDSAITVASPQREPDNIIEIRPVKEA